jgi:hypothetical protein
MLTGARNVTNSGRSRTNSFLNGWSACSVSLKTMSKEIDHFGDYGFNYTHVAMSRRAQAKQEFDAKRKEAA